MACARGTQIEPGCGAHAPRGRIGRLGVQCGATSSPRPELVGCRAERNLSRDYRSGAAVMGAALQNGGGATFPPASYPALRPAGVDPAGKSGRRPAGSARVRRSWLRHPAWSIVIFRRLGDDRAPAIGVPIGQLLAGEKAVDESALPGGEPALRGPHPGDDLGRKYNVRLHVGDVACDGSGSRCTGAFRGSVRRRARSQRCELATSPVLVISFLYGRATAADPAGQARHYARGCIDVSTRLSSR